MSGGASWIAVVLAGVLEVVFAIGLKASAGWARPGVLAVTALALAGSLGLLSMALRTLPVGTAYAVWTGIGAAGTALAGALLLGDPVSWSRAACLAMIAAGVLGLRAAG